jgi:hypothetical protein
VLAGSPERDRVARQPLRKFIFFVPFLNLGPSYLASDSFRCRDCFATLWVVELTGIYARLPGDVQKESNSDLGRSAAG